MKLVKSYVESVMRYGLPVDFSAFVLAPKKGQETKVKDELGGAAWRKPLCFFCFMTLFFCSIYTRYLSSSREPRGGGKRPHAYYRVTIFCSAVFSVAILERKVAVYL